MTLSILNGEILAVTSTCAWLAGLQGLALTSGVAFKYGDPENSFSISKKKQYIYIINVFLHLPSVCRLFVYDYRSTDFDQKSSLSACSLMHLLSACRFFVIQFLLEFRQKFVDFGVLFDAFTFGVSNFCV